MNAAREVNFDGLVGPTHNYAGLSRGNLASMANRSSASSPREAALQGLAKMRLLLELGFPQAVLPPHERPQIEILRRVGFSGDDARVLEAAARDAPGLLAAISSASAMWTANAATVAPSSDTRDGRVHLTAANLAGAFHRALEGPATARLLRAIFADPKQFVVHDPLPAHPALGDEGAANHTRLCRRHHARGLHLFVHGRRAFGHDPGPAPARFPARQTREASEAVARLNQLGAECTLHLRQSPAAIDAGAFHNDVVSVGNENVLLYHESAYADPDRAMDEIRRAFAALDGGELFPIRIASRDVSLEDAIATYLLNSQLLSLPDGAGMLLLAPSECRDNPRVSGWLDSVVGATPIRQVRMVDLRQSMRNGGGPACLRLRVVLTPTEEAALPPGVIMTHRQLDRLETWVRKHYRDFLLPEDLADPRLLEQSRRALDELTQILGLGSLYSFQQ